MKRIFILLIAITTLAACNKPTIKKDFFEDGTLKSEKTFEKIDGKEVLIKEIRYHPNGKKYIEGNYNEGLREGKWTSWYNDGQLWSEGNFKQDKSDGERTVYHSNGKLHYKGAFDMGKRVGIWLFYDEFGVKINEINYDKTPESKD
ncbi:MAG: hypothetical protein RBR28_09355 [Lentimicrobium sp.]|jgi:antitoxin component YwqK of YwqJK toxin-antitoxin module|nr:hypothetical protein [Lentimicrobium sp.]